MVTTEAVQIGPCRDLNQARTVRFGAVRVEAEGRRLRFVGTDGMQVSLSVDNPVALARQIVEQVEDPPPGFALLLETLAAWDLRVESENRG